MRLVYCETDYSVTPPKDISSILTQEKRSMAICSRQGMVDRLAKLGILAFGIWELSEEAIKSVISVSNIIFIIGRDRIHPLFEDKIKHIEEYVSGLNSPAQEHSLLC